MSAVCTRTANTMMGPPNLSQSVSTTTGEPTATNLHPCVTLSLRVLHIDGNDVNPVVWWAIGLAQWWWDGKKRDWNHVTVFADCRQGSVDSQMAVRALYILKLRHAHGQRLHVAGYRADLLRHPLVGAVERLLYRAVKDVDIVLSSKQVGDGNTDIVAEEGAADEVQTASNSGDFIREPRNVCHAISVARVGAVELGLERTQSSRVTDPNAADARPTKKGTKSLSFENSTSLKLWEVFWEFNFMVMRVQEFNFLIATSRDGHGNSTSIFIVVYHPNVENDLAQGSV
ncbi:hypothetical protein B0H10DRAFT_2345605 [Mycena sp. CBHHK59/15]|nr:hypothetical protein B0H10DRAFT_2345605 [Mycena sp. CBHHK59/15]